MRLNEGLGIQLTDHLAQYLRTKLQSPDQDICPLDWDLRLLQECNFFIKTVKEAIKNQSEYSIK